VTITIPTGAEWVGKEVVLSFNAGSNEEEREEEKKILIFVVM
jgi:hypothetical protein